MRVLMICNKAPFPPNDGSSIAIYNMARGLMANGAAVHLLTVNTKKHFKPDENIPEAVKEELHYRSVYRDTDVSAGGAIANLISGESYFVSRFFFKEFVEALKKALTEHVFDVVQIEGVFMCCYLDLIRKYSKARVVLRAHNVEYLIWERHLKNERSVLKKKYIGLQASRLKRFEEEMVRKVDAVVSITEVDAAIFRKIRKDDKVYTCITGIEPQEYENKEGYVAKAGTAFIFSSMDWLPNIEAVDWFMNNCWEAVRSLSPGCKLVIAGRNMPPHILNYRSENVEVVENVRSSKEMYLTHQVMLVPLLSGSGLRIKIIEGMAYGKAIVSTPVGAEGIEGLNSGNICLKEQAKDLAAAVAELLNDEQKRKQLEANARKHAVENFNNKKVVEKLMEVYKN